MNLVIKPPSSLFTGSCDQRALTRPLLMNALKQATYDICGHLGHDDIKLRLVIDTKPAQDFARGWKKRTYQWDKMLATAIKRMEVTGDEDQLYPYCVALYKGKQLLGLCRSDIRERYLNIDTIEGLQDDNPLSGLTIAIFSQANVEIAKRAGLAGIMVDNHDTRHFNSYKRAGYQPDGSNPANRLCEKLIMPFSDRLEVNWDSVLERFRQKDIVCSVPKETAPYL